MSLTQISTEGIKDGTITGSDLATNVDLADNQKIRIGTGNDLQLYHEAGFHSYIRETQNGNLVLWTNPSGTYSTIVIGAGQENSIICNKLGSVELYHIAGVGSSTKKFETTSNGVKVNGVGSGAALDVVRDGNECIRMENTTGVNVRILFRDNASRAGEIRMFQGNLGFSPNSSGAIRYQLNESGQGEHNYTTAANPKEIYNWSNNRTGMSFRSGGVQRGNIFFFDSGVQFNTGSDYRLKENVTSISDGITRVKQLIPRKFNWIIDESNTPVDGFLAHEVSSIVPEAVNGTKDAVATEEDVNSGLSQKVGDPIHQMIDHSKLVPLLAAGLKEAISKIEILETEVAALKAG